MIRRLSLFVIFCQALFLQADPLVLELPRSVENNADIEFKARANALALNVDYAPIKALRPLIAREAQLRELRFFTGWEADGEAHVTVITPPEFQVLGEAGVSLEEINEIARAANIQASDLRVLGLGSGKIEAGNDTLETFFVIVESSNLRAIRLKIYDEYLRGLPRGTKPKFNPSRFYPHITVGYSARDLHESDGVFKDITHSWDTRFDLQLRAD